MIIVISDENGKRYIIDTFQYLINKQNILFLLKCLLHYWGKISSALIIKTFIKTGKMKNTGL